MAALSATVERRGDASLVELVVTNDSPLARRVRIANRLDGPVWPPRSEGVPEDGWDDGGFEGVLGPGERVGLGYACPTEPVDPPAEVAWCERAADCEPRADGEDDEDDEKWIDARSTDPDSVLQALGDPRPPRDAVGSPTVGSSDADDAPEAIEEWFGAVEGRIERGRNLADASTLLEATRSVEREGSLRAVERLVEQLEADAVALRRVERRAAALAKLAEDATENVPVSAFRRLS